jgi:hypothetical protein
MPDEKTDKKIDKQKFWIENIKWFVASVLIVVIALIVDSGFKRRELKLKEIDRYDEFVKLLVANSDNIGAQYKLASFYTRFCTYDDIKEEWKTYLSELKKDYDEYLNDLDSTNSTLYTLQSKPEKTAHDTTQIKKLKDKREVLQKIITPEIKTQPTASNTPTNTITQTTYNIPVTSEENADSKSKTLTLKDLQLLKDFKTERKK